MNSEAYDVIRIYKQENKLIEINTWVKNIRNRGFDDSKLLNTVLVNESNL